MLLIKISDAEKRHRGFSLIELVIVVAIIGILALMILPQFSSVSEEARLKTWNSNCQSVAYAINMYLAGHNGEYPETAEDLDEYINGGWNAMIENAPRGTEYSYAYDESTFTGVFTGKYPGQEDFVYPTN